MKLIAAAIGDVHLEGLNSILPRDQLTYQLKAIRRVLSICRKLGIRYLIQAGDLFHSSSPDPITVIGLAELMLEFHDIRWIIICGNHDRPLLHKHSMRTLDWLGRNRMLPVQVVLKPMVRKINGVPFFLCPHPFIEDQPNEAAISIGHFPWSGAKRDNGSVENSGSSPKGRWLLGDFHTAQEGKRWSYIGSLTQMSWQERLPKGFDIISLSDEGDIDIRKRIVRTPYELRNLAINYSKDFKKIENEDNIYYSLLLNNDITLPSDWQGKYPNILAHKKPSSTKEIKQTLEQIQLSDDPFDGLEDYLIDRGNLSDDQIRWGVAYVNKARRSLGRNKTI